MDFHPRNLGLDLPSLVSVSNPRMFRAQAASLMLHSVVALLLVLPVFRIAVPARPLGLDEKAVEAVRVWRFKPARDPSGRFVPMWVAVEVTFRLL
jgi:hypothetical protein